MAGVELSGETSGRTPLVFYCSVEFAEHYLGNPSRYPAATGSHPVSLPFGTRRIHFCRVSSTSVTDRISRVRLATRASPMESSQRCGGSRAHPHIPLAHAVYSMLDTMVSLSHASGPVSCGGTRTVPALTESPFTPPRCDLVRRSVDRS